MAKGGFNSRLVFAILAAAVGSGFQHGYHTGVINVPQGPFQNYTSNVYGHEDQEEKKRENVITLLWSTTTSIMNLGGTIGGLLTGVVTHKFGPRMALILNNILLAIATVLMGIAAFEVPTIVALIIGRLVIGINCGLNAGLCPMYLSEIAPVSLRGAISSVYQLVITISILIAMFCGLNEALGQYDRLKFLFYIPLIFGAFQVIGMIFCPDSPAYLMNVKGDLEKTEKALKWFRQSDDVAEELSQIKSEYEKNKDLPKVTLKDMFRKSHLRTPLIIAVMLMVAQQFSGINAIMFYSTDQFEKGGLTKSKAQWATIGVGTVNVAMTVVSVYLVEVAGRKTLLLVGFGGMAIDTALVAVVIYFSDFHPAVPWGCVVLVFVYIILFAAGAGSIPWFLVSEIFEQSARPTAVSMAVPTNWISNFVVTMLFPILNKFMKSWVFFIFTGLNALFFAFILLKVPETKNKPIQEITSMFT